MSRLLLRRGVAGCFGKGDRMLLPAASVSASSVRGCKMDLLLLVDIPRGSESGSGEDEGGDASVAGGAGAV